MNVTIIKFEIVLMQLTRSDRTWQILSLVFHHPLLSSLEIPSPIPFVSPTFNNSYFLRSESESRLNCPREIFTFKFVIVKY